MNERSTGRSRMDFPPRPWGAPRLSGSVKCTRAVSQDPNRALSIHAKRLLRLGSARNAQSTRFLLLVYVSTIVEQVPCTGGAIRNQNTRERWESLSRRSRDRERRAGEGEEAEARENTNTNAEQTDAKKMQRTVAHERVKCFGEARRCRARLPETKARPRRMQEVAAGRFAAHYSGSSKMRSPPLSRTISQ